MAHSTKKLDLTGQRFGKLVAVAPAANIGARTAWLCRCDCGRQTVVKTDHLRAGRTRSCGCVGPHPMATYIDGTCVEMIRAKTVRKNNTSGIPGVDWCASRNVWRASICFKRKRYYLGSYSKFEDAARARKLAEENLHDRFLEEIARSTQGELGGG